MVEETILKLTDSAGLVAYVDPDETNSVDTGETFLAEGGIIWSKTGSDRRWYFTESEMITVTEDSDVPEEVLDYLGLNEQSFIEYLKNETQLYPETSLEEDDYGRVIATCGTPMYFTRGEMRRLDEDENVTIGTVNNNQIVLHDNR